MYQHSPRGKARAIAITRALVEERRKAVAMKALMLFGLLFGVTEAAWAVHHLLGAR